MGRRRSPETRRRILDAASICFNENGIRAVSADSVIDRSSVAKMTLYTYFPTKEDLAAAYVRDRSERWMAWLRARVDALGRTPMQKLFALFDALEEWFGSPDYHGCPFHGAAAEFPDLTNPIHDEVARNKRELRAFIAELLADAGFAHSERLAKDLAVLMAGAEIMANIEGAPRYAEDARRIATMLLRSKSRLGAVGTKVSRVLQSRRSPKPTRRRARR